MASLSGPVTRSDTIPPSDTFSLSGAVVRFAHTDVLLLGALAAEVAAAADAVGGRAMTGAPILRFGTRVVTAGDEPCRIGVVAIVDGRTGDVHHHLDSSGLPEVLARHAVGAPEVVDVGARWLAPGVAVWDLVADTPAALAEDLGHLRPPASRALPVWAPAVPVVGPERSGWPAFGLPGAPDRPADPSDADVSRIGAGRCSGVLVDAWARGGVRSPGGHDAARWAARHRDAQAGCLLLEQALIELLDALAAVGVEAVALKGPVSVHDGPLPEYLRDFGDLDLLLRGDDLGRAVALLEELGFARRFPSLGEDFERRFAKSVTMLGRWAGTELEVDLHRTLAPGPFGELVDLEALHSEAVPVRLHGRWIRGLHPRHRLLHTSLHIATGSDLPRLSALRDLALWAPPSAALAGEAAEEARLWRAGAVVQSALQRALEVVPVAAAWVEAVARLEVSGSERRLLATYHRPGAPYALPALATLAVLPDVATRLRFARAHLRGRRNPDVGGELGGNARFPRGV